MKTTPKHRQLMPPQSSNTIKRSPVNQKQKLSPDLQTIRSDAVQRWIRKARENNVSRNKERGPTAMGAFNEKFGYRCDTIQIRGSILKPSARFTPTAEAVEFLSSHKHPLHIICEIGDPVIFSDSVAAAKGKADYGWAVSVYSEAEYAEMRMFLAQDGGAGFALKEDGDLVSVFGNKSINPRKNMIAQLLLLAVENGARKADCFDIQGFLPNLYARFGFNAVCKMRWNDEFKPSDWRDDQPKPDVVFLSYQGGQRAGIIERYGKFASYTSLSKGVPYAASYEEAIALQHLQLR